MRLFLYGGVSVREVKAYTDTGKKGGDRMGQKDDVLTDDLAYGRKAAMH